MKNIWINFVTVLLIIQACTKTQNELQEIDSSLPNVLIFLVDDLGWADLGCYGSTFHQTPNIDAFAKTSRLFKLAYAPASVCSPSRAAILSGKNPARLHLTDWTGPDIWHPKGKLKMPEFVQQLSLEETTLAEALAQNGYATCFLGKWHVGWDKFAPEHQGFHRVIGSSEAGGPPSFFHPYYNEAYEGTRWPATIPGFTETGKEGEYLTDRLTDEAVGYLDTISRPFYMQFNHFAVHRPLEAKSEKIVKYQAKVEKLPPLDSTQMFIKERESIVKVRQDHPVFASMLESVDESFGRLIKALKLRGELENTIIIFTSDNGGLSSTLQSYKDIELPTSELPLRTGKGWLYEGGIRVPMLIGWGNRIAAGVDSIHRVVGTDIYPTVLELAGLDALPEQHQDGLSLAALLMDKQPIKRQTLHFHYPHYHPSGQTPASVIIEGDYKLIQWYEYDTLELYNISEDVGETNNLVAQIPEKALELQQKLEKWLDQIGAQQINEQ